MALTATDLLIPLPEGTELHPAAQALVTSETASLTEIDTGPLGSDGGADVFISWIVERAESPRRTLGSTMRLYLKASRVDYTPVLLEPETVRSQLAADADPHVSGEPIYGIDEAIIAVGLAQLFCEGRIDADAREPMRFALKRQLIPEIVAHRLAEPERQAARVRALHEASRLLDAAPLKSKTPRIARERDPRKKPPWEDGRAFRYRMPSGRTLLLVHSTEADYAPTFYMLDWYDERMPTADELLTVGFAPLRCFKLEIGLPEKLPEQSVEAYWHAVHQILVPTQVAVANVRAGVEIRQLSLHHMHVELERLFERDSMPPPLAR